MIQIATCSILHPLYTNKKERRLKKHYSHWHVGREWRRAGRIACCMLISKTRQVESGKTPAITLLPERKKIFGESRSFMPSYNSFPRQEEPF